MFVMLWQLGSAGHPVAAGVAVGGAITGQGSLGFGQLMNGVLIPGGNVRRYLGINWRVPRGCIPSTERRESFPNWRCTPKENCCTNGVAAFLSMTFTPLPNGLEPPGHGLDGPGEPAA